MTRHSIHAIGLALAGAGLLATAAAQAQTSAADIDCATFMAMNDGQVNAVAAVVEAELAVTAPPPAEANEALLAAGIDPAAVVATPAPAPGETARVLKEACAAAADARLMDALMGPQAGAPAAADG